VSTSPAALPPPPDPKELAPVASVEPTTAENVGSGIFHIFNTTGADFSKTPAGQAIERHHQQRLATAQMNQKNANIMAAALGAGEIGADGKPTGMIPDPKTGEERPMTAQERELYLGQWQNAHEQYAKAAGVDKDTKAHIQKQQQLHQFLIEKGHKAFRAMAGALGLDKQQQGGDAQGGGTQPSGPMAPPPSPSGVSADTGGGAAGAVASAGPSALPPPPAPPSPVQGATAMTPDQMQQATDASQKATAAGATELAKGKAQINLEGAATDQRKKVATEIGLTPGSMEYQEFVATGKFPAVSRPTSMSKGVAGDVLDKQGVKQVDGSPLDPKGFYDLFQNTDGTQFAVPSGAITGSRVAESENRSNWYKERAALVPYQVKKIIQDMQLAPEKMEIARANSMGRWFGPTTASRQSSQFGGGVEDMIDNVEPLIAKLNEQGKISALRGRWEQIWTDKIRSGDPDFAKLGTQMDILAYAVQKMHGFRNPEQAKEFINSRLNEATDNDQLIGSLEGLRSAARNYESMGQMPPEVQDAMEKAFAGGQQVKPKGTERLAPPPKPGGTTKFTDNGRTYNIPNAQVAEFKKDHPNAR